MIHEDVELEEEKKPSVFMRVFIILVGLFCIALIISYVVVDPRVGDIVGGLAESERLNLDTLSMPINKEQTLTIAPEVYTELKKIYFDNVRHEFKVCLLGEINDQVYNITALVEPTIHSQSSFQVISDPCPDETLVLLHTHPYKRCIASQQDIKSLKKFKETNEETIMGVMCEVDRFNLYK